MVKRRPTPSPFNSPVTWKQIPSDDDDESSDNDSVRPQSPTYTDVGSSSGEESSESESEPDVASGWGSLRTSMARRIRGTSLIKLVTSKYPGVKQARNILGALTPDEIDEELRATDGRGNSVIHYVCLKTLVPWLELITQHGGDLEAKGVGGKRPIHLALKERARNERHAREKARLVELLVAKKVEVNVEDNQGQTPLQLACKFEGQKIVIRALLSHPDIRVDQPVKHGRVESTLLNISCHNGQFENALLLLKHNANPLAEDGAKDTPLYIILRKGHVKYALRFLITCQKKGYDMRQILSAKNVYNKTVLHEAIITGHELLVKFCLDCMAPNDQSDGPDSNDYLLSVTSRYNTNVMHSACMKEHLGVAILLYDLCPKLLDARSSKGWTPLHYACRGNYAELAEELCSMLQSHDERSLQLTMDNEADESPPLLKFTAMKGSTDCLVVLLKHVKDPSTVIELIKWVSAEKNLSKVLEELLSRFDYICTGNFEPIDVEKIILLCAARGQTESLLQFIAWRKHTASLKDDNENSVMHLIAEGTHLDTAKAIIKTDNAVLNEGNSSGQTALHLAIREGHKQMTKLFLITNKSMAGVQDDNGMTPLMYACQKGDPFIVDLLLELKEEEIKFSECDKKGLNCLDHAINDSHEMVAVQLLSQENWRTLMTHSTNEGDTKTTPMRKLIEYMPGVGKFVLDKCITRLPDSSTCDKNCTKIKVYYELLEDWFSDWMEDTSIWQRRMTLDTLATRGYDMMLQTIGHAASGDSTNGNTRDEPVSSNFLPDGKLRDGARIYVTNPVYRSHNHPLRLMIKTEESKELLNHPVLRLLFLHKHKATRLIYWVSFFLLLALLILVTGHSLVIPPPFYIQTNPEGNNYTWLADGQTKWQENLNPVALVLFGKVGAWIILVLTAIYFIEFLYRSWMYRHSKYNSISGILSMLREIGIQLFTILFVLPGFNDLVYGYGVHFKADWQWQLGAFAVFLAWFNFILFLQTVPLFGIYVLMFLEVLSTLLNFIFVAGIFLLAFAVVFCILLLNQAPFHTLGDSLAKALAMMTGEIELSAVFHILDYSYEPDPSVDFTSLVFYPVSTHIIYVIFIIFMPILIMNLLTGLAVYDIEVIQTKAKMHKQTLEAKGTLDFQDNMFLFLWKASVVRDQVIPVWTKISSIYKLVYKVTGYKETYDQLVTFLEDLEKTGCVEFTKTTEMRLEDMAENITDIANRLSVLSENAVDAKTRHLEAMSGIQELKQQVQALHNKL